MNEKIYAVHTSDGSISKIPLTPLGGNLYRLGASDIALETPIFLHDVIEAKRRWNGCLRFYRVVERSGLRVYDFLLPLDFASSPTLRAYFQTIENDGGYWEMIFGGILLLHVPPKARLRPRRDMRALLKDFRGKS